MRGTPGTPRQLTTVPAVPLLYASHLGVGTALVGGGGCPLLLCPTPSSHTLLFSLPHRKGNPFLDAQASLKLATTVVFKIC